MKKKNQLKSCCKNNLSSPNTHHSSSRSVSMRDIVAGVPNASLYPGLQISGMTSEASVGFTLIELLVVVLIIGILAAVALPQYTLAVNKTRFASLRSTANALVKASEVYFLANGTWATDFDSLAADLPTGITVSTVNGGTCGVNNEMYCCIIPNNAYSPAIVCGRNDYTFAFHASSLRKHPEWENFCIAKKADTNAVKLCKSLGTPRNEWGFFTPTGSIDTGYRYYTIN